METIARPRHHNPVSTKYVARSRNPKQSPLSRLRLDGGPRRIKVTSSLIARNRSHRTECHLDYHDRCHGNSAAVLVGLGIPEGTPKLSCPF